MLAKDIRQKFLDFYQQKDHKIIESAPMVLKNDPTLMFTNAGMNQFKDIFLENKKASDKRVANSQKCLRVSGKHNDLEEVGKDTYHHTMFEMLGNWSFGDYFKKEAIEMAWELLTQVYKLDKKSLYVTYFEGSVEDNLGPDDETKKMWESLIDESRILKGNKADNFWEMGDVGPCGPCSEIHIDLRTAEEKSKIDGKELVNAGHPQVVEIWNLVFIQYNRLSDGHLQLLPNRHVDTGMGFERLCMALQKKTSNYDTDLFAPLIKAIGEESKQKYGKNEQTDIAIRVIADHVRAVAFAIADGQLPSNTGAGYVIRRILRRAVRYAFSFLSIQKSFLFTLVKELTEIYAGIYPELQKQQEFIEKVMLEEENNFRKTLESGLKRFDDYISSHSKADKIVDGNFAFELYDTFGFPPDLTALLAEENSFSFDETGFNKAMSLQKKRSKDASKKELDDWVNVSEGENSVFVGYDHLETDCKIIRYRKVQASGKEFYHIILDKTPFYAESGGQTGDKGVLSFEDDTIEIIDTIKENELTIHVSKKQPKDAKSRCRAIVLADNRENTSANHSATHLLHASLKKILGNHVEQKGSLVRADYLRFDFSHFQKMTDEEIRQIEQMVNEKIRENIALDEQRNVPFKEAIAKGATALFGEKYSEEVRVITFEENFSSELCGGTHVQSTGEIGVFKIISESAVSAGVRRIEAVTGQAAENWIYTRLEELSAVKKLLKNPQQITTAVEALLKDNQQMAKKIESLQAEKSGGVKEEIVAKIKEENGIKWFKGILDGSDSKQVKDIAFQLRQQFPDLIFIAGIIQSEKPQICIMISDSFTASHGLDAGKIVREAAVEIKGGGGGQAFFATAGGSDVSKLKSALDKAESIIKNELN
ncbi:MAG: alanine--tRNA ligase [Chitinophagaceae bacterium]|nr:MAG: alanine--tRNA ligase [Chitinophagaceae bacterium]